MFNNVLLSVAAATVLLGTLYPLFLDALGLGKISVGPPYFEAVFVPLMIPVLLLMPVAPWIRWKQADAAPLLRRLLRPGLLALALGVALAAVLAAGPMLAAGVGLACWIILSTVLQLRERLGKGGFSAQPLAYWGMIAAHAGVGVFVAGVTLSRSLDTALDAHMKVGEPIELGDYSYTLRATRTVQGPNYQALEATIEVTRGTTPEAVLLPQKRMYLAQEMPMTEAAIDRSLARDLYVSLGEQADDGSWTVRLQIKPFLSWIWIGCLVMAGGGLLAVGDRRYRLRAGGKAAAIPVGAGQA